jgi:hypothetical protein
MPEEYRTVDKFDRMMGALTDLPDVAKTKPSTVSQHSAIIGASQTFIIQTFRQREQGDTIFIQYVDDTGSVRLAIPPAAADAIARQRESLTLSIRKRIGKEAAQARKARGEQIGFTSEAARAASKAAAKARKARRKKGSGQS